MSKQNDQDQAKRIEKILANCPDKNVNEKTLAAFHYFLKETLPLPCEVIGKADLIKYHLYAIENSHDDMYGILAKLKLQDNEKEECIIPLCDIKGVYNRSLEFVLIDDYSTWFVNSQW